jgi:hypothetical protein
MESAMWLADLVREEDPMKIVGFFDLHRQQITFDYVGYDTVDGPGHIARASRTDEPTVAGASARRGRLRR